jgi:hypothetical protein
LQPNPKYIKEVYLKSMIESGILEYLFPHQSNHPQQAYLTKKIMKALLLACASSKEQEEGQSIPAQERRLREYADRKGLVVGQVFKITESSTKDTRKEFEKILEIIRKSKETLALVADTIDRVQRSFKESVVLEKLRKEGKVEIHFMREGLVPTAMSKMIKGLRGKCYWNLMGFIGRTRDSLHRWCTVKLCAVKISLVNRPQAPKKI